jgi:hypothetical protein
LPAADEQSARLWFPFPSPSPGHKALNRSTAEKLLNVIYWLSIVVNSLKRSNSYMMHILADDIVPGGRTVDKRVLVAESAPVIQVAECWVICSPVPSAHRARANNHKLGLCELCYHAVGLSVGSGSGHRRQRRHDVGESAVS